MVVIFLEMAKTYLCETYSPKTEFSQRKLKIQETFLAASCAQTYVVNLDQILNQILPGKEGLKRTNLFQPQLKLS